MNKKYKIFEKDTELIILSKHQWVFVRECIRIKPNGDNQRKKGGIVKGGSSWPKPPPSIY